MVRIIVPFVFAGAKIFCPKGEIIAAAGLMTKSETGRAAVDSFWF